MELKVGPTKDLPDHLCLIPKEHVDGEHQGEHLSICVGVGARRGSLPRRGRPASAAAPRIAGHESGALVGPTEIPLERVVVLAPRLQQSTLCIQGPPGTGKTFTAAAVIVELLGRGHRVGVTAQSHKVILKLMDDVLKGMRGPASPHRSTR